MNLYSEKLSKTLTTLVKTNRLSIIAYACLINCLVTIGCGAPTIYRAQPSVKTAHISTQNAESTSTKKDLKDSDRIIRGVKPTEKSGHTKGPFKVATFGCTLGLRKGPHFGSAAVCYPAGAATPYANLLIVSGCLHGESSMSG